jgi:MacB-like protein
VEMATICFAPPGSQSALVLNAATEDEGGGMMVNAISCDYDYIPMFDLEMADGRNFSEENASDANGGLIMNEAAIKQLGIEDPVGKELSYPLVPNSENNSKIIGVLKDFHYQSLREEISPVVLFLDNQYSSTLIVKYHKNGKAVHLFLSTNCFYCLLRNLWVSYFPGRAENQRNWSSQSYGSFYNWDYAATH